MPGNDPEPDRNALESLVIAGFVRGLSTRDVEAALTEALGEQAAVSKSTVSRICTDIKEQFETWCQRAGLRLLQDLRRGLHDLSTQLPQWNSGNHTESGVSPTESAATA